MPRKEEDPVEIKMSELYSIHEAVYAFNMSLDRFVYNHMFFFSNIHNDGEFVYFTCRSGNTQRVPFIRFPGHIKRSWRANLE